MYKKKEVISCFVYYNIIKILNQMKEHNTVHGRYTIQEYLNQYSA